MEEGLLSTDIDAATRRRIRDGLLRWFRREARDLPFRRTRDPYAVWLSEIMFQQTRIDQGLPYYERFIRALPSVEALAAVQEDAVLKLWEGLGYYRRARNLHRAAKMIVEAGDGFPQTAEQWMRLPGIGRYTAGAIASIAFGERVPVLDGNVTRVLTRLFDIDRYVGEAATIRHLWDLAGVLVPAKDPGAFNQAMMELGARMCMPRQPRCAECPVRGVCEARARGTQDQRPCVRPAKRVPHHEVVVAAIVKNGRYLLGKRPEGGMLGGLWEFPGGKVEPGETHRAALVREAREELGIRIRVKGIVAVVNHAYSHFRVTLNVYRCEWVSGTPRPNVHAALRWIPRSQLTQYPLPKANHKFLELL